MTKQDKYVRKLNLKGLNTVKDVMNYLNTTVMKSVFTKADLLEAICDYRGIGNQEEIRNAMTRYL